MKLLRVSVVTPSLNKSFKFQSDWPYNNSQVYLLNSIIEDLEEDEDREFKTREDGYYFSSSVHYPNNKSLVKQNVYVDKNGKITKVEVVDKEENVQILMNFKNIEFNKKFDKNYFELSNLLNISSKKETEQKTETNSNEQSNSRENSTTKENNNNTSNTNITNENNNTNTNENGNTNNNTNSNSTGSTTNTDSTKKTEQTATIDDIVYPMYLPNNTYLTSQEKIDTANGQRLILTFGGDSSFVLVEETANYEEEGLVIPVSGEFDFLSDVIGVIGTNSITWQSNGIDYYMASETIEAAELVDIARSISVLPVSK